jgi:DNA-binding GntR family transcriptional regulator
VDIDSSRNAQFLRLTLELEIARTLAGQSDKALIDELNGLVRKQRACWKRGDLDGFIQTDQAFHERMFYAAGTDQLWRLVRGKSGNMDRLRRLDAQLNGKAESTLHQHAAIVAAIDQGDPERADAAVRTHLSGTLSRLLALREQYPGYLMGSVYPDYVSPDPEPIRSR